MSRPRFPGLASRPTLLFFVAIILPCIVLSLLTLRMLVQDRELAEKRLADERRRLTAEVRQTLLGRAERLRVMAHDSPNTTEGAIALVARIANGQLVLPWQATDVRSTAASALSDAPFTDLIRLGEQLEFGAGKFAEAAVAYQTAARNTTQPAQRAFATLRAARAYAKARQLHDSQRLAATLMELPPEVVDDQGIPFSLYAARVFADVSDTGAAQSTAVQDALQRILRWAPLGPEAIYMARDVASRIKAADAVLRITERARDAEQAAQLRAELPTLGVPISTPTDPVWVSFGPDDNRWLINVSRTPRGETRLTALRLAALVGNLLTGIEVTESRQGESLVPHFPSLRAAVSPQTMAASLPDSRLRTSFYMTALVLVVSIAFAGAYFFWRDVRREIRVAEMRSQFVSSVSHELKTPLTAIRMFAETLLLGRSSRPEVQHEYLETIVNETERLTRLLNNVLDFSKIESGQKTYRLEHHSLATIVRAAVKAMHYPFSQQGFDLRVTLDEHLPPVAADADAVEQAILNLLSNAMKYSGESRVIELSLAREGAEAVIAVTDRGVGIAAEERTKIFDKFYRVRDASTERIAGTGLGLTLVDHVVRGHAGRISVQSVRGEGSTFAIHLPLLQSPGIVSPAMSAPA